MAVILAFMGIGAADAQTPGAADSREGLPESYKGPASAVAAIVNDTVITTFDVQQRMRLMLLSAGGRITPQMMPQVQRQALRDLVEEQLKLQEALKCCELTADEEEVEAQLRQIAAQGGLTLDQLEETLKADGVSLESLRSQIEAQIVWPQLVQGRYGQRVRVNEEEIDATVERMREDATQEQFLISEICIPVPSEDQAQSFYEGGLQLIEQMRKGVPFAVVAQQFSACTTAAAGGDMGWVRAGELPPELDAAVRQLPPGAVTNPIPTEGAFMILAVRDKREAVEQGEKSWTLAYAGAPLSIGRNAARIALEKLPAADACSEGAQRQDLGAGVGIALIENATLGSIDQRFRDAVADLERGEMSPIIEADEALHAVFACAVDEGLGIPARAEIEDRLYGRQLERIAQQYLRDVERRSTVDIRLRTPAAEQAPSNG